MPVMVGRRAEYGGAMRVTAKADYAIRAVVELGARHLGVGPGQPLMGEAFCENILSELREAGVVESRRGADGGYWLAREPATIRLGDIIRIVEGPLAAVRGERPTEVEFTGSSAAMQGVWVAVRAALRGVLDTVTVADVVTGRGRKWTFPTDLVAMV
jgi:Rrf2 family protein